MNRCQGIDGIKYSLHHFLELLTAEILLYINKNLIETIKNILLIFYDTRKSQISQTCQLESQRPSECIRWQTPKVPRPAVEKFGNGEKQYQIQAQAKPCS